MTGNPQWTARLQTTSNIVHIGGLVVAVVSTVVVGGLSSQTVIASLLATVGVLMALFVSIPFRDGSATGRLLIVSGVLLFSAAIALTGGLSSTFVIMPVASIYLAAMAGGIWSAIPTALLSIGGVMVAAWASNDPPTARSFILVPSIYLITALAFSEVQRALASETERVDGLLFATQASAGRTQRLEATHDLLEDLLKIATSPDVNAVATAHDALRDVGVIVPTGSARIVGEGNIILARRGQPPPESPTIVVPITRNGAGYASLEMWLDDVVELTPSQISAVQSTVSPIALALENDQMVQQLAGLTIQRERVRLARELHDDVAPSIASVGLALDMVLMGGNLSDDQRRTLDATRSNVTRLVDRIRDRVQDLRADRSVSVVEVAHSLVAEVDADGPSVVIDIDERTPPRPAIAVEVGALLTEAFRNAIHHSHASAITITGRIDADAGSLVIADNGDGFDASDSSDRRYGLVGMEERATLIGANLKVSSAPGQGTTVNLQWEDTL